MAGINGGSLDYVPIGVTLKDLDLQLESNGNQIILNAFKGATVPITAPDGKSGSSVPVGLYLLMKDLKGHHPF